MTSRVILQTARVGTFTTFTDEGFALTFKNGICILPEEFQTDGTGRWLERNAKSLNIKLMSAEDIKAYDDALAAEAERAAKLAANQSVVDAILQGRAPELIPAQETQKPAETVLPTTTTTTASSSDIAKDKVQAALAAAKAKS